MTKINLRIEIDEFVATVAGVVSTGGGGGGGSGGAEGEW